MPHTQFGLNFYTWNHSVRKKKENSSFSLFSFPQFMERGSQKLSKPHITLTPIAASFNVSNLEKSRENNFNHELLIFPSEFSIIGN